MPTWPSASKASTTNVDAGTDQISLARADIKQNMDNVNDIIDIFNIASPTNGDLMQYNSSTTKWEKVASTAIGQTAQLIIPFTGWVVSEAAADSNTSSAGAEARKFRQALLGGAYYLRGPSTAPSLTSAASTYGSISGASVTRATPTLVEPTGYSFSLSGGNYAGNITNGVLNSTGAFAFTTNVGEGVSNSGRCWYATGYDNYVTLPTGTYTVEIRTANTSSSAWTNTYTYNSTLNSNNDTINNMSVYNRTDNVMITPQDETQFTPSDTQLNPTAWPVNSMAVFTLSGTKNIQFVNRVNPNTINSATHDALGIRVEGSSQTYTSGDLTPQSSGQTWHFFKNGAYIPSKLGWVTLVPNTWIVITKLS